MDKKDVKLILNEIKKLKKKLYVYENNIKELNESSIFDGYNSDENVEYVMDELYQTMEDLSDETGLNILDFYMRKRSMNLLSKKIKKGETDFDSQLFPFTLTTAFVDIVFYEFDDFQRLIDLTKIDYFRTKQGELEMTIKNARDLIDVVRAFNKTMNWVNVKGVNSLQTLFNSIQFNFVID